MNEMLKTATSAAEAKRDAALEVYFQMKQRADADAEIERRESEIMADVCAETNGDGKPAFGNDTARKAELAVRAMGDGQLKTLVRQRDEAARKLAEVQAVHAYQHDIHRAYVAAMYAMRED